MLKKPVHSHEHTYLSWYTTCSSSVLNMEHDRPLQQKRRMIKLNRIMICQEKQPLQSRTLAHLRKTNMHGSYTYLMHGKYSLFYESPKNWEYYTQTVYTRPLLGEGGGGGLGTRLRSHCALAPIPKTHYTHKTTMSTCCTTQRLIAHHTSKPLHICYLTCAMHCPIHVHVVSTI